MPCITPPPAISTGAGIGDIDTLTVREYLALSRWGRLRYRIYRHPVVMFGIGPAYLFLLQHRLPVGLMRDGWQPWLSTMATNVAIALIAAGLIWLIGSDRSCSCTCPLCFSPARSECGCSTCSTSSRTPSGPTTGAGISTMRPCTEARITTCRAVALVHGQYRRAPCPPSVSRIPYYRLPRVLRDFPELRNVSRLTLVEGFRCVRLALWDEGQQRLISFREMRQRYALAS